MKKILSLILALAMMLIGAAMAESTDSVVIYCAVIDPVVSVDGSALLDMTGLGLELDVVSSESSQMAGVILHAYVGENYDDNVIYAQAQLDENGVAFGVDGLSNLYSVPASMLGDVSAEFALPEFTSPDESLRQMIDNLTVSGADGVATLYLSKEDGKALLEPVMSTLVAAASMSGQSVDASDVEGLYIELDGEAAMPEDGSISMSLSGNLGMEGEEELIPVTLTAELTADNTLTYELTVSSEDNEPVISIEYITDIANENGEVSTVGYLSASMTEDDVTYEFATYLNMGSYAASTADWALDTSSTIDVTTMDETQQTTLQMGLLGIAGTAGTKLQENVPGLAEVINSLMSGINAAA